MAIISIPEILALETYPACLHQHLLSTILIYLEDKSKITSEIIYIDIKVYIF